MELFADCALDALIDSAKMLPLLFVIYVIIEIFEHKLGNKANKNIAKSGKFGPIVGALTGIIPQCGVSVVATALFNQRLVTIGTLFAVYIATSDEAIPVILSNPDALPILVPLLVTKLIVAIVVGYLFDLAFLRRRKHVLEHAEHYSESSDDPDHHHEVAFEEKGCCGHTPGEEHHDKLSAKSLILHPLEHTIKIFIWLFVISFVLALLFALVGEENIGAALSGHPFLQPLLAAVVGLIPNCAASVAITQLYISGVISFGATCAGLCAGGGLGVLVLVKEESKRDAFSIIGGLFVISVVVGIIVQMLPLG